MCCHWKLLVNIIKLNQVQWIIMVTCQLVRASNQTLWELIKGQKTWWVNFKSDWVSKKFIWIFLKKYYFKNNINLIFLFKNIKTTMIFINLVEPGKTAEPNLAVSLLVSRHDNMFSLLGGFDWAALRTNYSILSISFLFPSSLPGNAFSRLI